eukprot:UN02061
MKFFVHMGSWKSSKSSKNIGFFELFELFQDHWWTKISSFF